MDRFEHFAERLLELEGGLVRHPADPGGLTKWGISARSYPQLDIASLTRGEAIAIYRRDFWERPGIAGLTNDDVAWKVFQLGVNVGPRRAIRFLQEAVRRTGGPALEVDGVLGPQTLRAVNHHPDPKTLVSSVEDLALAYYQALGKPEFLRGWMARARA